MKLFKVTGADDVFDNFSFMIVAKDEEGVIDRLFEMGDYMDYPVCHINEVEYIDGHRIKVV